jgi:catechol 2,3-dioxygenase-like lactoylglutathione lyase family enzyme
MSTLFKSAIPKLASADIGRSIAFYKQLGFSRTAEYSGYGIAEHEGVEIHFWLCHDPHIAQATGCRINVEDIEPLFEKYSTLGIIHPNDPLADKPWALREFSILDPDGNLVTFSEKIA